MSELVSLDMISARDPSSSEKPHHRIILLAPTGALVLMMVYDISAAAAATFSDFEHLCLSILLQVSLYVA